MNFPALKKFRVGFCSLNKMLMPLLFMGFLVGCQKHDDSRVDELQNQVTQLATLTSNQSKAIAFVWNQNLVVQTNLEFIWNQNQAVQAKLDRLQSAFYANQLANNSVSIMPDEGGYGLLKTPYGNLFVSTEGVEPYQDGYKIHLKIGNPTSAHFTGFSLICSTYQGTNAIGTFHAFTNEITDELSAGYWTPIDFVLAPASADEVRNASVSIELNDLELMDKPPPPP